MRIIVILLLVLFSTVISVSQRLSPKEMEPALQTISKLVYEKYVFPDMGKKMSNGLIEEYKKGRLKDVKDWRHFDSITTKILKEISHDGHMYVSYDPKTTKELTSVKELDTKEQFSYDPFYYGEEAIRKNFGLQEVKVLDNNIGYLKVSEINISEKSLPVLIAAMKFVSATDALIIDLQNNRGGGSSIGNVFESFFLPKETPLLEFHSRENGNKLTSTVPWLLEEKYKKPLYILVNKGTASAAEAFSFALQFHKRAVIVGQPSAGGAHMSSWYPVTEELYVSISTAAPTLPGTEISWEQKGVMPDHLADAGQEIALIRKLLEKK